MLLLRVFTFLYSLNVPTVLTIFRLIISPILLPLVFVHLAPAQSFGINCVLAFLFVLLSSTDFLDGYLARLYSQQTRLGSLLDPIADKFLLYSTLVSLVAVQKLHLFIAIILIGREFLVMTLRQSALSRGFSLSVSSIARVKTCVQMVYLTYVIVNPFNYPTSDASFFNLIELLLLLCALYLTIVSTIGYCETFYRYDSDRWQAPRQ